MNEAVKNEIEQIVNGAEVVLFMKGRRRMPQCGFSGQIVSMLDQLVEDYTTVNVLDRPEIRDGIKAYSDWPTIPQLYIKGEFVGGCDIVTQLFQSGDLHKTLDVELKEVAAPTVTVTDGAKAAFEDALKENPGHCIRFEVDARFQPGLDIDTPQATDFKVETNGLTVLVSRMAAERATGATIDFISGPSGGFKIENPNEPARVRQMEVADLKGRIDAGDDILLLDVRTPEELAAGKVESSRLLDEAAAQWLEGQDKTKTLVFICHSGARSQQAAETFLQKGFTKVYNVAGGMVAWNRLG